MNANELANELDNMLKAIGLTDNRVPTMLRQQQAEIERLIGAKPITYGMLTFCKNCGQQNPYQAKTLTDEEIENIAYKVFEVGDGKEALFNFARAILRKAQEK